MKYVKIIAKSSSYFVEGSEVYVEYNNDSRFKRLRADELNDFIKLAYDLGGGLVVVGYCLVTEENKIKFDNIEMDEASSHQFDLGARVLDSKFELLDNLTFEQIEE